MVESQAESYQEYDRPYEENFETKCMKDRYVPLEAFAGISDHRGIVFLE